MKKYKHLKEKAIILYESGKRFIDIKDMLNVSKGTLHYWLKDIKQNTSLYPERSEKQIQSQLKAARTMKKKWEDIRKKEYEKAYDNANEALKDFCYRDFILIYMCEGYRKSRFDVSVSNSDFYIIKISHSILLKESRNKIHYGIQYHIDQDLEYLKDFWSNKLAINKQKIKVIRKSNSNNLSGRNWASKYGVFNVRTTDVFFKQRVDAHIDYIKQKQWN